MKDLTKPQLLIYFSTIALTVIALSQLGSYLVNTLIPIGSTIEINSIIHFTHIRNMGGVFGLFQGKGWAFALFSLLLIAALIIYLLYKNTTNRLFCIALSLILGGALGNLWDRIALGHVVDFLDFHLSGYHWPAFNIADSAIFSGACLLILDSIRSGRNDSVQEK